MNSITSNLAKWKAIDLYFQEKWKMSFYKFEIQSKKMLNGFEFELEQEYYDWEDAITMIHYYEHLVRK